MARWDPGGRARRSSNASASRSWSGPPTFFVSMMQAPGFGTERVASLRLISSGGAGVGEAFVAEAARAFGARVKRTYGSTEVPTIITDGHTIGEVEVRIDDERRAARARPRGVRRLPRRRADTRRRSPPTAGSAPATSPTIDADGAIEIVGRLKDVIIRGGENISTRRGRAGARSASRRAPRGRGRRARRAHGRTGRRRSSRATPGFDLDACRAWFAARGVARFKTPERVVVVDALPLLPDGQARPRRAATPRGLLPGRGVDAHHLEALDHRRGFSVPGFQWKLYMRSFATFCTNIFAWSRFTRMPRVAVCFS